MEDFSTRLGIRPADPAASDRPGDDAGLALATTDEHVNRNGTVHGGVLATLLDAVMGQAVREGDDDVEKAATISMTVTYLNPGDAGTELHASAEVRQRTAKLVMVEGEVTQGDGEPVAHAVATYAISRD